MSKQGKQRISERAIAAFIVDEWCDVQEKRVAIGRKLAKVLRDDLHDDASNEMDELLEMGKTATALGYAFNALRNGVGRAFKTV